MAGRILVFANNKDKRIQIISILQDQGFDIKEAKDFEIIEEQCIAFNPDVMVFCMEDHAVSKEFNLKLSPRPCPCR